jgi:hypothetical protein
MERPLRQEGAAQSEATADAIAFSSDGQQLNQASHALAPHAWHRVDLLLYASGVR